MHCCDIDSCWPYLYFWTNLYTYEFLGQFIVSEKPKKKRQDGMYWGHLENVYTHIQIIFCIYHFVEPMGILKQNKSVCV